MPRQKIPGRLTAFLLIAAIFSMAADGDGCSLFVIFAFVVLLLAIAIAANRTESPRKSPPQQNRRVQLRGSTAPSRAHRGPWLRPGECWQPPGRAVRVAGFDLPDGMVYVGEGLLEADARWNTEPALIHPKLSLDRNHPDLTGESLPYWPSYRELTPAARAGYLGWLAGGRKAPQAPIGFVFLFFYGLERRLLVDPPILGLTEAEGSALRREIARLLEIYGNSSSFSGYASSLLAYLEAETDQALVSRSPGFGGPSAGVLPTDAALALGHLAVARAPIPPDWALAWLRGSPTVSLRTPVRRCWDLFRILFRIRYAKTFGDGLILRPNKTRLELSYYPASEGIEHRTRKLDLPDVNCLSAPLRKLADLAESVTSELDSYSRWLSRRQDGDSPLHGLALLPAELTEEVQEARLDELKQWLEAQLEEGSTVLPGPKPLIRWWPTKHEDRMLKKETTGLSQLLERLGVGLEPDVRFAGPMLKAGAPVVLFRQNETMGATPSKEYVNATLLLHLASTVAAADGEIGAAEEEHLEGQLEEAFQLAAGERHRLRAHLKWLLAAPPGFAGIKKRTQKLSDSQRHELAMLCVTIAGADGRIDSEEVKILEKIYSLLGLDRQDVFSDLHQLTAGSPAAEEPVTVRPADSREIGFALPQPASPEDQGGFRLDPERVRQRMRESEESSRLLAEIFSEEEDEEVAAEPANPTATAGTAGPSVAGLDPAHQSLLEALPSEQELPLGEFERLAEDLGLLANSALDVVNEAALDLCDEPLLEGEDPLEINPYALKEMLG
ncbi:MAG: TerB N-terminal domain-containing protein [Acidobacteriota bacterium]|nr:TerB N-terminal domain-containing protein [Acidobacteriota bacterium]